MRGGTCTPTSGDFCVSGETSRHTSFRSWHPKGYEGATPSRRTVIIEQLGVQVIVNHSVRVQVPLITPLSSEQDQSSRAASLEALSRQRQSLNHAGRAT